MTGYDIQIAEMGRQELLTWLRLNNLDPNDVAAGRPLRIECDDKGTWGIAYTAYLRGPGGRIRLTPDGLDALTEERFVQLLHDPPMKWLTETVT